MPESCRGVSRRSRGSSSGAFGSTAGSSTGWKNSCEEDRPSVRSPLLGVKGFYKLLLEGNGVRGLNVLALLVAG